MDKRSAAAILRLSDLIVTAAVVAITSHVLFGTSLSVAGVGVLGSCGLIGIGLGIQTLGLGPLGVASSVIRVVAILGLVLPGIALKRRPVDGAIPWAMVGLGLIVFAISILILQRIDGPSRKRHRAG